MLIYLKILILKKYWVHKYIYLKINNCRLLLSIHPISEYFSFYPHDFSFLIYFRVIGNIFKYSVGVLSRLFSYKKYVQDGSKSNFEMKINSVVNHYKTYRNYNKIYFNFSEHVNWITWWRMANDKSVVDCCQRGSSVCPYRRQLFMSFSIIWTWNQSELKENNSQIH